MLEIKRIGLGAIHASGCAAPKTRDEHSPTVPPPFEERAQVLGGRRSQKSGAEGNSCFVRPTVFMSTPNTKREQGSRNPDIVNLYPKENRAPQLSQESVTVKASVMTLLDGSLR